MNPIPSPLSLQYRLRPARSTIPAVRLSGTSDRGILADLLEGTALLALRPERGEWCDYWLSILTERGRAAGYRLNKIVSEGDEGALYDIDITRPTGWECDCGDCTFRQRECKHIRAILYALRLARINPHDPLGDRPPIQLHDL